MACEHFSAVPIHCGPRVIRKRRLPNSHPLRRPMLLRPPPATTPSARRVRRHYLGVWTWFAGVLLLATNVLQISAFAADIADGRTSFLRYCASCHGAEADGHGYVAPALTHPPSDLRHLAERNDVTLQGDVRERHDVLAERLARFIDGREIVTAHGTREMPVWGERFDADQAEGAAREKAVRERVNALAVYLLSIQMKPQP